MVQDDCRLMATKLGWQSLVMSKELNNLFLSLDWDGTDVDDLAVGLQSFSMTYTDKQVCAQQRRQLT